MKKRSILVVIIVLLAFWKPQMVQAAPSDTATQDSDSEGVVEDLLEDVNYDDVQKVIDEILTNPDQLKFKDYVASVASGEEPLSFTGVLQQVMDTLFGEIANNRGILLQLLILSVVAAIFTNFANIFHNNQVSDTAFYVTYLMMFSILTSSFYFAVNIASDVLDNLFTFMKVLMPTYMLSVAVSAGAKTSLIYYETTLAMFTVINVLLLKIILPLINIYFVLTLANYMSKEDKLSKLTELIEMVVKWALKTILAVVIGFNAIQGLILPMAEHVKNSAIIKGTSIIPGVGNAINTVTETVLGAGVVVKNAIGVFGLIIIITICLVPIVKLAFFIIVYKFGEAIVQPISDKRILGCMGAASNAARLLLSTVFIAVLLFMLSIALVAASTNLRL